MRRRLRPPPSSSVRWVTLVIEIWRSCFGRRDNGAFAPQNCIGNTGPRDNENDVREPVNYENLVAPVSRAEFGYGGRLPLRTSDQRVSASRLNVHRAARAVPASWQDQRLPRDAPRPTRDLSCRRVVHRVWFPWAEPTICKKWHPGHVRTRQTPPARP